MRRREDERRRVARSNRRSVFARKREHSAKPLSQGVRICHGGSHDASYSGGMIEGHAHIYFLVHKSHERFKVGVARHPLQRWAQIQPHDHTDFRESLVFDVAPEVSHRWVERTLHRAIADARVDMPGSVVGYTEWFDYQAYDSVRRFAADHRDLLGLGDGYTLAKPSRPEHTPAAGQRGRARSGWESGFPDDALAWNNEAATFVEKWSERLLASGSLMGTAVSEETLYLFFRRERVTIDEVLMHPRNSLISVYDVAPGSGGIVRTWISGGARDDGTLIRLSLSHSFPLMGPRDRARWAQATPGIDRVWAALSRLIASAPPLAARPWRWR